MIVRIATFDALSADGRDWVTEALRGVPGVRSCYHASRPGIPGYISVSVMDDEKALEASNVALTERREELGIPSQGPDRVEVYAVDHFVENVLGGE
ncbi:MAG TPA: hypothetical protein VNA14_01255 [Mycobacteriales bacterium]|nr:hypothetical protein [Mycobacteriales bacterium]